MFELDKWQEIGNSLWQHKLRTFLTSVGISWGIFMLIFLLGLGKGLENGVIENFGSMNKNAMWVWGQKTSMPYKGLPPGRFIGINNKDYRAVHAKVEGIDLISPRMRLWETVIRRKNDMYSYTVNGVGVDYNHIKEMQIVLGRELNQIDVNEKRKVIFIGKSVAEKFFKNENPIGHYLDIKGAYFKIIGVFKSKALGENAKDEEESIFTPYTAFQQTFNKINDIGVIVLSLKKGYQSETVEKEVKRVISDLHTVNPKDESAVGAWGSQEEFNMISGLFSGINLFIWLVGLGTILIGIISISNIMLIIVKERTKEIGLRKALGASPASVVGLVLHESIVLTSVSGFIGLVSGVFIVDSIAKLMLSIGFENDYFGQPEVDLKVAIAALLILIFAGTLAGLIPAIHAAKIDPIEALRTE